MNESALFSLAETYLMDTYASFPLIAKEGRGSRLKDLSGKEYIDFTSGIGVNALGFSDPEWAEAVSRQAASFQHLSNLYLHEPEIRLAEKLCAASGMKRVFFANSGAEANEGAVKTARKYSFDKYGPGRHVILTLNQSFHGRTITTLKATGQESFHSFFHPFTEGFRYIDPTREALLAALSEDVCAILLEPIQGEGGVNELGGEFLSAVQAVCAERDILLLVDEIQTGIGRTGAPFAFMESGLTPDVLSLAKGLGGGLPIGAFLVGERCERTLGKSHHGSTFGGNPIACAGATVILDRVLAPDFLKSVTAKGERLRAGILAMNSPHVTEVRGRGLMLGIVLHGLENKTVNNKLFEKGLLCLTAGGNVLRLLPPLNISDEDIDEGLSILKETLF